MASDIASDVRAQFPRTPPPKHISETPHDEGTTEHFAGTNWWDHRFSELELQGFALRCFTPEAAAYFLPAFLLAAIEHPDSGLADCVVDFLVPPKNDPRRNSYWRWWSLLSPEQRLVAIEVVKSSRFAGDYAAAIQNLAASVHASR